MKRLLLVRHAKSSWKDASLSDFDRPLNSRGKHDAPLMAGQLKKDTLFPDQIKSSPAARAKATSMLLSEGMNLDSTIVQWEPSIYEASATQLEQIVCQTSNKIEQLMLVGHNPGMTYFAEKITGEHFGNLPTCGIVGIEFSFESWEYLSADSGSVFFYQYPKMHY